MGDTIIEIAIKNAFPSERISRLNSKICEQMLAPQPAAFCLASIAMNKNAIDIKENRSQHNHRSGEIPGTCTVAGFQELCERMRFIRQAASRSLSARG
ncbi:hypothetical protein ACETRX_28100 [Labrys portucalensis]|uniref:Uncharacterized protein n=1 Tax=Labrys neptuniae TaxID=376174 RepID=A0ABV6ZN20_9HYPH